jgi:hypothetical protein
MQFRESPCWRRAKRELVASWRPGGELASWRRAGSELAASWRRAGELAASWKRAGELAASWRAGGEQVLQGIRLLQPCAASLRPCCRQMIPNLSQPYCSPAALLEESLFAFGDRIRGCWSRISIQPVRMRAPRLRRPAGSGLGCFPPECKHHPHPSQPWLNFQITSPGAQGRHSVCVCVCVCVCVGGGGVMTRNSSVSHSTVQAIAQCLPWPDLRN